MANELRAGPALERVAGEALSAFQVVALVNNSAFLADNTNSAHTHLVTGITLDAAILGANVLIHTGISPIDNPAWSFTPGAPLFANSSGGLTETAPITGAIIQVGVAVTATKVQVLIRPTFL